MSPCRASGRCARPLTTSDQPHWQAAAEAVMMATEGTGPCSTPGSPRPLSRGRRPSPSGSSDENSLDLRGHEQGRSRRTIRRCSRICTLPTVGLRHTNRKGSRSNIPSDLCRRHLCRRHRPETKMPGQFPSRASHSWGVDGANRGPFTRLPLRAAGGAKPCRRAELDRSGEEKGRARRPLRERRPSPFRQPACGHPRRSSRPPLFRQKPGRARQQG